MNLRDLKYLVALADLQHFRKAAEACFVSQPTLSMQIKKLEESLGVQLLERNQKSVRLTDIGALIAERARDLLKQAEEIQTLAKQAKDPYGGELKIGIIPTLAPYLLPLIMPHLNKIFPKLQLYLVEEKTARLLEKLKQGKLDAVISALPTNDSNLTSTLLFPEEFQLAISKSNPLIKRKKIKQSDLKDLSLLLLEEGHCLRDQALELCYKFNATETKGFQATSLETLRHMVVNGNGVTLMPKLACTPTPGMVYLPFTQPKPSRNIGICWRNLTSRYELTKKISNEIQNILVSNGY